MTKIHSILTASLFAASVGAFMAAPALAADVSAAPVTPVTKAEAGQAPVKTQPSATMGKVASKTPAVSSTSATSKVAAVEPAKAAAAPKMVRHAMLSRHRVEHIQTALDNSGAKIAIDGIWGPKTTVALKDFQLAHNLNATGHLDHKTLTALPKVS